MFADYTVVESRDGTRKYLWTLADDSSIESVLIPDGKRLTLCISTQVGCAMGCRFCLTADMGLVRQLSAEEIIAQPQTIQELLPAGRRITNLVMMGMGEPLHNFDNLCAALDVILDPAALGFSHRRVTVSTVGLVRGLRRLAARHPVNLAVSLNASTDEQRSAMMPINARHDIAELLETCRTLPISARKRIVFEYVMMAGFNSTLDDADRLAGLLRGLPAKVNLLPYNQNPRRDIRRPSTQSVHAFADRLIAHGIHCSVRATRGQDIAAACGQLGKVVADRRRPV